MDVIRTTTSADVALPLDVLSGGTAPKPSAPVKDVIAAAMLMIGASPLTGLSAQLAWQNDLRQGTSTVSMRSVGPKREQSRWSEPREELNNVARYFSLTKIEMKQIFGVSRQTIYEWLAGEYSTTGERLERLNLLGELANRVHQRIGRPLPSSLVRRRGSNHSSLLETLQLEKNPAVVRFAVDETIHHYAEFEARSAKALRTRLGFKPLANSSEDNNLADNLDELVRE